MHRATALLAMLVLALTVPATASAQQTNAPPGNSAIDEYLETVPGSTGDRRPGGQSKATLTPSQRQRLEQLGPDGKVLADVVDATAAPRSPAARTAKPAAQLPDAQGRSPVTEVIAAATGTGDGGGLGLVLPAILLATLLGAIVLVVLRRRSDS